MISKLRILYGDKAKYLTLFPDGTEVPWNPLTIGAYLRNVRDIDLLASDDLEDRIFRENVTNDYLVKNADILKSGTIATVAHNIVVSSWPGSETEFSNVLEFFRNSVATSPIEGYALLILRAFPSYTPDDIYQMDLETFMHRLALAERLLLETGQLKKPLQQKKKLKTADLNKTQEVAEKVDLRKEWAQQQKATALQQSMPEVISAPDFDGTETVIGKDDLIPLEVVGTSAGDYDVLQRQMLKETATLYKNYLSKDGKITPEDIKKGVEDKIKTFGQREEKSKQFAAQQFAKLKAKQQKQEVAAAKKFEKGLKKKRRRGK